MLSTRTALVMMYLGPQRRPQSGRPLGVVVFRVREAVRRLLGPRRGPPRP